MSKKKKNIIEENDDFNDEYLYEDEYEPSKELKIKSSNDLITRYKYGYYEVNCPICGEQFEGSAYLKTVFKDDRSLWLANMVMHYRHDHITSWNKMWGYYGGYYRQKAHFGDYDEEKKKVNERAKRQIARQCKEFIVKNNINAEVYEELQNTTDETLKVVNKIFEAASVDASVNR